MEYYFNRLRSGRPVSGPAVSFDMRRVLSQGWRHDARAVQGAERKYDLRGEAVVADLGDGRYLFALIGSNEMAERAYWDLMGDDHDRGALLRAIRRQKGLCFPTAAPTAASTSCAAGLLVQAIS